MDQWQLDMWQPMEWGPLALVSHNSQPMRIEQMVDYDQPKKEQAINRNFTFSLLTSSLSRTNRDPFPTFFISSIVANLEA